MAKALPKKTNFTDRWLKSLKPAPKGERIRWWDAGQPALTIRITDKGTISFIVVAPMRGKQTYHVLGRYPVLGLAAARKEVPGILALYRQGISPKLEAARERADTLEAVVDKYLAFVKGKKRRSADDIESVLRRHFLGQSRTTEPRGWVNDKNEIWRNLPVLQITRRMIVERLDEITKSDGKFAARKALSNIRAMLNWCEEGERFGLVQSPAARIRDTTIGIEGTDLRRQRVLTDVELRQVWEAAGELGSFGSLVKLLMLSGQRRNDWALAQWSEIDFDKALLTIPASRFKTAVAHEVPLTPRVIEILQGLPTADTEGYLFTMSGQRAITSIPYQKEKLDELIAKRRGSPMPHFVLHDLRRSCRTRLADLNVETTIAELIIGHAQPGLHRVYNLSSQQPQKRAALEVYERWLLSVVEPKSTPPNVVSMKRRA